MGGGSRESQRAGYHHGELRQALLGAGIALAQQGGPDAVVLREASRRAGVSHTAAYRHFADREALLAAVAEAAAAELASAMEQRLARVRKPRRRLRAIGEAYIDFALREPGLFQTASTGAPAMAPQRVRGVTVGWIRSGSWRGRSMSCRPPESSRPVAAQALSTRRGRPSMGWPCC
jgi:AcrR family transcriptional regulator